MSKKYMKVDGITVEFENEKNILEVVEKIGINLPTLCYWSDLSVYGACRMCMVETQWGSLTAACSTPPKDGMDIRTNTERLYKYRKMNLELLLSNHCRDCVTCEMNGNCKLQQMAKDYGVNDIRFENHKEKVIYDSSSLSIVRNPNKCILCGDCVRMCGEVQNVGAIDFIGRGPSMHVGTLFDGNISDSNCVGCGQCAAVCPTGAIIIKDNRHSVWNELHNENKLVVAQIAPAVRTAIAKELKLSSEVNVFGKLVAGLRRIGFDLIFDTSTGADFTAYEESKEFLNRIENDGPFPMFTSCCPAWVKYCEDKYENLLPNLSTCKSPMQMFSTIIKEQFKNEEKQVVNVAIMPCTAKKEEAARKEFINDGKPITDYVITTQEIIQMFKESSLDLTKVEAESLDRPFGTATGSGVIFGVTGGVTEAIARSITEDKSRSKVYTLRHGGQRGNDAIKVVEIPYKDKKIRIAVVSGLNNAETIIKNIKEDPFDLIEVMACPGGCVCGAGQPYGTVQEKDNRGKELYKNDQLKSIKHAEYNPILIKTYEEILKGREKELLHVHY